MKVRRRKETKMVSLSFLSEKDISEQPYSSTCELMLKSFHSELSLTFSINFLSGLSIAWDKFFLDCSVSSGVDELPVFTVSMPMVLTILGLYKIGCQCQLRAGTMSILFL